MDKPSSTEVNVAVVVMMLATSAALFLTNQGHAAWMPLFMTIGWVGQEVVKYLRRDKQ